MKPDKSRATNPDILFALYRRVDSVEAEHDDNLPRLLDSLIDFWSEFATAAQIARVDSNG
jgi:hypothetical protein